MKQGALLHSLFYPIFAVIITGCSTISGVPPAGDGGGSASDGGTDGGAYCAFEGYDCAAASCCQGYTCDASSKRCSPTSKQALGDTCSGNSECASGLCYNANGTIAIPYCSRACKNDMDCVFGDSMACCNGGTCEIISAAYCGDRSGGTGHGCFGGGSSDCKTDLFCSGTRNADGTFASDAICSKTCASTAECVDLQNPETLCLVCESGGASVQKHCKIDLLCAGKCTSDSACTGEGERCSMQPVLDKNGKTVDLAWGCSKTCQWGGKKGYDEACTADGECCSPLCMRGRCVGACASDVDCGSGHLCEGITLGLDPDDACLVARLSMCVNFTGAGTACDANSDCSAGEYCQYAPDKTGAARFLCGKPEAEGKTGGEPCHGSGSECRSSLCSTAGYCLDLCRNDNDCPTNSGKMVCALLDMGGGAQKGMCLAAPGSQKACKKDADCPQEEACEPFPVKDGSRTLCVTALKTGRHPGETCTESAPCSNELCLTDGICSAVCAADADCPVAPGVAWLCARIGLQPDSFFPGCVPMHGSGKPCQLDTDCAAGEACKSIQGADGKSRTVCGTDTASGADKGAGFSETCAECADPCDKSCVEKNCYNDMCMDYGKCSMVCRFNADCGVPGWICAADPESGLHFCTEIDRLICTPCATDADCLGTGENFCNELPGGGKACGTGCDPKLVGGCPDGYSCTQVFDGVMTPRGYNCLPSAGSCPSKGALRPSVPGDGRLQPFKVRTIAGTGDSILK